MTLTLTVSKKRTELMGLSDGQLVAKKLEGDELAFTVLTTRYWIHIRNFIARKIGDQARADDLAQEAFLRVHKHLHRFDQSKKFSTWLFTIANNLRKNELRNRSRNPLIFEQRLREKGNSNLRQLEYKSDKFNPERDLEQAELRSQMYLALDKLPQHHREAIILREFEGRTYEEMAAITGQNLGTVKSRLNRARASFAENLICHYSND